MAEFHPGQFTPKVPLYFVVRNLPAQEDGKARVTVLFFDGNPLSSGNLSPKDRRIAAEIGLQLKYLPDPGIGLLVSTTGADHSLLEWLLPEHHHALAGAQFTYDPETGLLTEENAANFAEADGLAMVSKLLHVTFLGARKANTTLPNRLEMYHPPPPTNAQASEHPAAPSGSKYIAKPSKPGEKVRAVFTASKLSPDSQTVGRVSLLFYKGEPISWGDLTADQRLSVLQGKIRFEYNTDEKSGILLSELGANHSFLADVIPEGRRAIGGTKYKFDPETRKLTHKNSDRYPDADGGAIESELIDVHFVDGSGGEFKELKAEEG